MFVLDNLLICLKLIVGSDNKLNAHKQVVKETLRMASVVQWLPRVALEDCEIQGLYIIL